MNPSPNHRVRFRWRALTSVLITAAFLVLVASGAILFIAPPGRVANWTNWAILGLRKSDWAGLHIVFSALFLVAAVGHALFNWRPLLGYFRSRWGGGVGLRWEWVVALALGVGVYGGTRAGVPPFSTLIAYSESFRETWDTARQRAPIPHAELLTVRELADQAAVDMATATARLQARGIQHFTTDTVVRDVAEQNRFSARQIYEIMTANPTGAEQASGRPGGAARGQGPGAGGGAGRKTLAEFCADEGIDLRTALNRLEAKSIKSPTNLSLREIALANGYTKPYELLEIVRGAAKTE